MARLRPLTVVVLGALLLACGEDLPVDPVDTDVAAEVVAPSAHIDRPMDGSSVVEAQPVTLYGSATAADLTLVEARWSTGRRVLCEGDTPGEDGRLACVSALGLGESVVTLTVTDGQGLVATDTVTLGIVPSGTPALTFQDPDARTVHYSDQPVWVSARASDREDPATALRVTWRDALDDLSALSLVPDERGDVGGQVMLRRGPHRLFATVTDTDGKASTAHRELWVGPPNVAPRCAILEPEPGSYVPQGSLLTLRAIASDVNVASEQLVQTWESSIDGRFSEGSVGADGASQLSLSTLSPGEHVVTFRAFDEVGASCSDTIGFTIQREIPTRPVTVEILAPRDGAVLREGAPVTFSGHVDDPSTPARDQRVNWFDEVSGELYAGTPPVGGLTSFETTALHAGARAVTLRLRSSGGVTGEATVGVYVDALPTAPEVAITPAAPRTADGLTALIVRVSTDLERDPITYRYAWTVDGRPTAFVGAVLPRTATTRGQRWSVTVTPYDSLGPGRPTTASVTIENSAPGAAGLVLLPTPAYEGDTVYCLASTTWDDDGDRVDLNYAWEVNGVDAGVSSVGIDSSHWRRGDDVVCLATPTDGVASGALVRSDAIVISNSTPRVIPSSLTISPPNPTEASTLVCSWTGFVDADGDADLSNFIWVIGNRIVGANAPLTGAFAEGDDVMCLVTPFDGTSTGRLVVATAHIGAVAPALSE